MRPFSLLGARTVPRLLTASVLLLVVASPAAAQQGGGADSTYRAPAALRGTGPNGATLRCRDGSHPAPLASDAACDDKGGVLARYPVARTPAPPAPQAVVARRPLPEIRRVARPSAAEVSAASASASPRPPAVTRPPADASLLCADGTYVRADTSTARCAARGGVRLRLPWTPPRR